MSSMDAAIELTWTYLQRVWSGSPYDCRTLN